MEHRERPLAWVGRGRGVASMNGLGASPIEVEGGVAPRVRFGEGMQLPGRRWVEASAAGWA